MVRHHIHVNVGDANRTVLFYFVHKDYETITTEESEEKFHNAVTELNRVYRNYGRFATETGVTRLFETYGFVRTLP